MRDNYLFGLEFKHSDLTLLRFLSLLGILLCLVIGPALEVLPETQDPFLIKATLFISYSAILALSFFSLSVQEYTQALLRIIVYSLSIYLIYVLTINEFPTEYSYISLVIVFALAYVFKTKMHLQYYLLAVFLAYYIAIITSIDQELNIYIFLTLIFLLALFNYLALGSRLDVINELATKREELRKSEELFRNIFIKSPVGIALVDEYLQFIKVNKSFCEMLGYEEQDILGLTIEDMVEREEVELDKEIYKNLFRQNVNSFKTDKKYIRADGESIWVNLSLSVITNEHKESLFALMISEDITDRKDAEDKLRAYAGQLEESLQELKEFNYVVSHDLQDPLRNIINYLELIEQKYGTRINKAGKDYMKHAAAASRRMLDMINDLLLYSRAGRKITHESELRAEEVLEIAMANLQSSIHESKAIITHDELPSVVYDELQLLQIFQNLISNAIKYTNGKLPLIHIGADEFPDKWLLKVQDNGIGIDAEDADKIFKIFQRLHDTSKYDGTGIGLAICKKIVEKNGGEIWVESNKGVGSTFYFTILKR